MMDSGSCSTSVAVPATAPAVLEDPPAIPVPWRLAALLRIAHHVPGRVRLKLSSDDDVALASVVASARQFQQTMADAPGIRAVSLNLLARSCVVEYDPGRIPPAAWPDLLAGTRSAAAEVLLQALAVPGGMPPEVVPGD